MSNTELDPRVLRLWDQLRYAYEHGGGHSGHLNNALHTAKAVSKELCKAEAERDALLTAAEKGTEYVLAQINQDLRAERDALLAALQYAIKQVPEFATVPGIAAAIDAARSKP